jgi:hypothetical protein
MYQSEPGASQLPGAVMNSDNNGEIAYPGRFLQA